MKASLLLLCIVVALLAVEVSGQSASDLLQAGRCELFQQAPASCQGVLNSAGLSAIWTAPRYGITQEFLAAQLYVPITDSAGRPLTTPLDFVSAMPYTCGYHYLKLICPTYLRSCRQTNTSAGLLAVPLTPCRSVCNETNAACADFFAAQGLPPLSCDRADPFTGAPLYPVDGSGVPCLPIADAAVAGPVTWQCPPPLEFVAPERGADILTGLPCAMPCKQLIYVNSNDMTASDIVWLTLNWISFVLSLLTIVVFLAIARLRAFPYRTVVYIAVGIALFHMGFIGNTFDGLDDTLCESEFRLRTNSWCKAQVFFLYGPSLFASFWWVYQSFLVFWSIGLLKASQGNHLQRWELPLLLVSAVFSIGAGLAITLAPDLDASGGTLTGFPFCAFVPGANTSSLLVWFLWILPLTVGIVAIIVFIGTSLLRVLSTSDSCAASARILWTQLLMIVYAANYLWVVASNIAFKSWSEVHSDQVAASFRQYYACLLTTFGLPADCQMTYTSPADLYWNCIICFGSIGLIMFTVMVGRKSTRNNIFSSLGFSSLVDSSSFTARSSRSRSRASISQLSMS